MNEQRPPRILEYQDFTVGGQHLVAWHRYEAMRIDRDELAIALREAREDAAATASQMEYHRQQVKALTSRIEDLTYEVERLKGEAA